MTFSINLNLKKYISRRFKIRKKESQEIIKNCTVQSSKIRVKLQQHIRLKNCVIFLSKRTTQHTLHYVEMNYCHFTTLLDSMKLRIFHFSRTVENLPSLEKKGVTHKARYHVECDNKLLENWINNQLLFRKYHCKAKK